MPLKNKLLPAHEFPRKKSVSERVKKKCGNSSFLPKLEPEQRKKTPFAVTHISQKKQWKNFARKNILIVWETTMPVVENGNAAAEDDVSEQQQLQQQQQQQQNGSASFARAMLRAKGGLKP